MTELNNGIIGNDEVISCYCMVATHKIH